MEPIIIYPSTESLRNGDMEFDCDCACTLTKISGFQSLQMLPNDAFLQTCQPIYTHTLTPDFELVLSPSSHTSLVVVNGPAGRILDFFGHGGTLQALIETIGLPETVWRDAVETLLQTGLIILETPNSH